MIDQIIGFFSENSSAMFLSICAMLVSILSLLHSRKNIKMQQYIETITNERIKWITDLRNEFSKIISYIYLSVYVDKEADEWLDGFYEYLWESEPVSEKEQLENDEIEEKIKRFRSMAETMVSDERNAEFVQRIDSLVMKLNDQDENDKKLIRMLESAKLLPFGVYGKNVIENRINEMKIIMRQTLKKEWERVKKEVQKGGLVNGKRKNIFD